MSDKQKNKILSLLIIVLVVIIGLVIWQQKIGNYIFMQNSVVKNLPPENSKIKARTVLPDDPKNWAENVAEQLDAVRKSVFTIIDPSDERMSSPLHPNIYVVSKRNSNYLDYFEEKAYCGYSSLDNLGPCFFFSEEKDTMGKGNGTVRFLAEWPDEALISNNPEFFPLSEGQKTGNNYYIFGSLSPYDADRITFSSVFQIDCNAPITYHWLLDVHTGAIAYMGQEVGQPIDCD